MFSHTTHRSRTTKWIARLTGALLAVPVLLSGLIRLANVAEHRDTMQGFLHQSLQNAVSHVALIGAVLAILWFAGHLTNRDSLTWNLGGPVLGGIVLTVGWLNSASDAGLGGLLQALPSWTAWLLLAMNVVALSGWWSIARRVAPEAAAGRRGR